MTVVITAMTLAALGGVTSPSPAGAAAADPVRETGVVERVVDGDTIDVVVDGQSSATRIRLSGIQAFEQGECGSQLATDRLTELVEGERVELRARVASARSDGRPIRSVHLPLAAGGTADINELLLLEGLGLWFPMEPEITDTVDYNVAATHARRLGRGIWRDDLCGQGPQHGHPIDLWVRSDADGRDDQNLNDEYAVIVNRHPSVALDLGGWLLRESSQFREDPREEGFRFPAGVRVPPGERIIVRVGSGHDTATEFFLGSSTPLFDNADRSVSTSDRPVADRGMGDGVYLLDPRGNVRVAFTWPCVVDCSTPLHGSLVIDHVEWDPPGVDTADNEFVRLRNVGGGRIHLDGYQLRNVFVAHEFDFGTHLDPGETLTVWVGSGTSTRTEQYWGQPAAMLRNAGDRVDVVSYDERFVDCVDWGTGRDCPWPIAVPGTGTSGALPTDPELRGGGSGTPAPAPEPGPFSDVSANHPHAGNIERLVELRIAGGYSDGTFRPAQAVTRGQMASFLTAALDLAPAVPDFADVEPDSTHGGSIGAVAAARITSGYPDGTFRPAQAVTRAQLATFLVASSALEPIGGTPFTDVPAGMTHAETIAAIAEARITSGYPDGTFRPGQAVTRGQMATFIVGLVDGGY